MRRAQRSSYLREDIVRYKYSMLILCSATDFQRTGAANLVMSTEAQIRKHRTLECQLLRKGGDNKTKKQDILIYSKF